MVNENSNICFNPSEELEDLIGTFEDAHGDLRPDVNLGAVQHQQQQQLQDSLQDVTSSSGVATLTVTETMTTTVTTTSADASMTANQGPTLQNFFAKTKSKE